MNDKLRSLYEQLKSEHKQPGDILCIYDILDRKLLYISPLFRECWGVGFDEAIKDPALMESKLSGEDFIKLYRMFTYPSVTPVTWDYKVTAGPGKKPRWIRTTVMPMTDKYGRVIKSISMSQEITKNDGAANKKEQLKMLGHLAAGFAHEIRNPLTSIKGFLQLAEEGNLPYKNIILQELEKIEAIINDFTMLAHPPMKHELEKKRLEEILQEVIMNFKPELFSKEIKIFMQVNPGVSSVNCSPSQIRQAIMHLVQNAIEAMPKGGNMYFTVSLEKDGQVSLKMIDEGGGIPPEKMHYLGEPYFSNKEKGAGLGLMISRQIIENHGGSLQIDSELGKGTAVEILFPPSEDTMNVGNGSGQKVFS